MNQFYLNKMTLEDLGYNQILENYKLEHNLEEFNVGRVILEHKDRYVIKNDQNEYQGELIGNLRYTAISRYDLPAVGDWVAFSEYDTDKALIHSIYPRHSIIERKAVGKLGQVQIIATNIDYGLLVQAVDRDFNLNRLERYITICYSSAVTPIIILSKIDLISIAELEAILQQIKSRTEEIQVISVSNQTVGYHDLEKVIKKGKTYCLLGSSGVGKSTLLNALVGDVKMKTDEISSSMNKGKHTTSHRELIVLENGGILIDNPGMREVGIADSSDGLETTFNAIVSIAQDCKYQDCTHTQEDGCAVLEALEEGTIDDSAYVNFRKMVKERNHFESDVYERRKKDKAFGKMIKNHLKQLKKDKY